MKANKFFAIAMATLALVACGPQQGQTPENGNQTGDVTITLDKESLTMQVGESQVLTATVTPAGTAVTWTSLNPSFVTVDNGIVTAVAEGTTIVLATAGSARAQCQVVVGKGSSMGGETFTLPEASEYYPLFVDDATKAKMGSKVKIDFCVEDVKNHWWPWVIEGSELLTYDINTATGPNFYGTDEGGYMALSATANGAGWAGGGYSVQADELQQLIDAINADPDKFYFHIGLRATDGMGNAFYFFGMEAETKFVIGASSIYSGTVYADFKRDGYWHEFDIPLSKYAAAFSGYKVTDHLKPKDGGYEDPYIFSYLTQWQGQLNYDALFFYKK